MDEHYESDSETTKRIENFGRAWRLVGMMFIAQGLSDDRAGEAERIIDAVVEIKTTELKSTHELRGEQAIKDAKTEFERECVPHVKIQEAMVESMRRGP